MVVVTAIILCETQNLLVRAVKEYDIYTETADLSTKTKLPICLMHIW